MRIMSGTEVLIDRGTDAERPGRFGTKLWKVEAGMNMLAVIREEAFTRDAARNSVGKDELTMKIPTIMKWGYEEDITRT